MTTPSQLPCPAADRHALYLLLLEAMSTHHHVVRRLFADVVKVDVDTGLASTDLNDKVPYDPAYIVSGLRSMEDLLSSSALFDGQSGRRYIAQAQLVRVLSLWDSRPGRNPSDASVVKALENRHHALRDAVRRGDSTLNATLERANTLLARELGVLVRQMRRELAGVGVDDQPGISKEGLASWDDVEPVLELNVRRWRTRLDELEATPLARAIEDRLAEPAQDRVALAPPAYSGAGLTPSARSAADGGLSAAG